MKKAFAQLHIKSADVSAEKRTFRGIASTPTPDRDEDVVEPKGASFRLPLPLLWQHNAHDPIGWVTSAKVTAKGIEVEGKIADVPEEGHLKDRLLEAWQMVKNGLVRGLSIGFRILEAADLESTRWGKHILKWEWLELSAVTVAANQEASIATIKAAFGRQSSSGATGQTERQKAMKTLQEQLNALKEARATKSARLAEISEGIKAKTATAEDMAEFDGLVGEVESLDNDIRLKTVEIVNAKTATPVVPTVKTAPAVIVRGNLEEQEKKEQDPKKKGLDFTRKVIAKSLAMVENVSPVAIAQKRWGKDRPELVSVIKADVEGGGSGSGEWGAELVSADSRYTGDFIEFLQEKTVFDQLPLREVPANVTIKGQDGAATANWVGESNAIPVSAQSFSDVSLTPLKVAALAVISNELLRDSTPAAEMLVRDQLAKASGQKIDATFLSTDAAVAGVSPAGMLNGVTPDAASGTDADSLRADIKTLIQGFITAKNAGGLHLVMSPGLALSIQMLYNALGQPEFPNINQEGGTLLGMPVHTGDNVATDDLIIIKPSDVYKIGDMGVSVEVSREAAVEMADNPAMDSQTPTGPTGKLVSMFQTESTAIKVVRPINFAKRRTGAVDFIGDAAYDNSSS